MAEDRQQSVDACPCNKDGDKRMAEADHIMSTTRPGRAKPIKIYPFTVNKLTKETTRYWFPTIKKQMEAQKVWETIEMHEKISNKAYMKGLSNSNWWKLDLKADMIMDVGLTTTTIVEVKDIPNTGEKWQFLKKEFMKSSNTKKMMKLMNLCNWIWDRTKDEIEA